MAAAGTVPQIPVYFGHGRSREAEQMKEDDERVPFHTLLTTETHLFWVTQYCFCVCVLQGVRAGLWGSRVKVRMGQGTHGYRGGGAGQGLRRRPALVVGRLCRSPVPGQRRGARRDWQGRAQGGW
jgi:hypothetical protein